MIRELDRKFAGFVLIQAMSGDQFSQVGAVDPSGQVVARGNREKCTGIVVESDRVIEACRLGALPPESQHGLGGVVEPPRRTQLEAGVVAGQRREFPRVGALVERKENEQKIASRAKAIQQWFERRSEAGLGGEVSALVAAEAVEQ